MSEPSSQGPTPPLDVTKTSRAVSFVAGHKETSQSLPRLPVEEIAPRDDTEYEFVSVEMDVGGISAYTTPEEEDWARGFQMEVNNLREFPLPYAKMLHDRLAIDPTYADDPSKSTALEVGESFDHIIHGLSTNEPTPPMKICDRVLMLTFIPEAAKHLGQMSQQGASNMIQMAILSNTLPAWELDSTLSVVEAFTKLLLTNFDARRELVERDNTHIGVVCLKKKKFVVLLDDTPADSVSNKTNSSRSTPSFYRSSKKKRVLTCEGIKKPVFVTGEDMVHRGEGKHLRIPLTHRDSRIHAIPKVFDVCVAQDNFVGFSRRADELGVTPRLRSYRSQWEGNTLSATDRRKAFLAQVKNTFKYNQKMPKHQSKVVSERHTVKKTKEDKIRDDVSYGHLKEYWKSKQIYVDPSTAWEAGTTALLQGDYKHAAVAFTTAIENEAGKSLGMYMRAETLRRAGVPKLSIMDATASLAINPNFHEVYRTRALAYAEDDSPQEALNDIEAFRLMGGQDDTELLEAEAYCLGRLGNYEMALECLDKCLSDDRYNLKARQRKCSVLKLMGYEEEAEEEYQALREISLELGVDLNENFDHLTEKLETHSVVPAKGRLRSSVFAVMFQNRDKKYYKKSMPLSITGIANSAIKDSGKRDTVDEMFFQSMVDKSYEKVDRFIGMVNETYDPDLYQMEKADAELIGRENKIRHSMVPGGNHSVNFEEGSRNEDADDASSAQALLEEAPTLLRRGSYRDSLRRSTLHRTSIGDNAVENEEKKKKKGKKKGGIFGKKDWFIGDKDSLKSIPKSKDRDSAEQKEWYLPPSQSSKRIISDHSAETDERNAEAFRRGTHQISDDMRGSFADMLSEKEEKKPVIHRQVTFLIEE